MAVKGPNHQMRTRIRGLTVLFALIGFGLVGVRLLYMQVFNHDFYVQQATALQTRDTFITPNRGKIYDANMQVLAESAAVERITVDPKAVVDENKVKKGITAESQQQTLATILSETLAVDYDTVMEKIQKTNSQYEIIAQKVDKDVSKELDEKLEAADWHRRLLRAGYQAVLSAWRLPVCGAGICRQRQQRRIRSGIRVQR